MWSTVVGIIGGMGRVCAVIKRINGLIVLILEIKTKESYRDIKIVAG